MLLKQQPNTAQNMKFSIVNFFSKCDQIRRKLRIWPADLVTFTEEIRNGKPYFLCRAFFLDYFPETENTNSYLEVCLTVIIKTVNYVHYISNHEPVARHQITLFGILGVT